MKTSENISSYIICILIALVFGIISLTYEYTAAKIVPLIVCSVVILLSSTGLTGEILKRKKYSGANQTQSENENKVELSWRRYAIVGAWLIGLLLIIFLFGFYIAVPLFLISYMIVHKTKWHIALSISVVTSIILYTVFIFLLRVHVYQGILFI